MSLLSQRIAQNNQSTSVTRTQPVMYSVEGAKFQERCLNLVGQSKAYSTLIGQLVTAINNNEISVDEAESRFFYARRIR